MKPTLKELLKSLGGEIPDGKRVYRAPRPRRCIACGHVHVTSEECGREPSEISHRDATVRRDDGYKLIQARNMGMFDDV